MTTLGKKAIVTLSTSLAFFAVAAAVVGVYQAIHSPLFTVQVVEVSDQVSTSQAAPQAQAHAQEAQPWVPVDPQTITDLAAVPVGQANLFDLDLRGVEKRILSNEWIREVRLQKRFPQTLSITPVYREPQAVIQLESGSMAYVDREGVVFGKVRLAALRNLPVISAADSENPALLKGLLQVLSDWESFPASKFARIESVSEDPDRGYRLMLSYSLDHHLIHARVDLGRDYSFAHLAQVLVYLHDHSIAARQIWADAGKKIVVKTAHGS
jgi:cell division septal protein FtsQ